MNRRNIELLLLCVASPIVIGLFAMLVVTGGQNLSFNTLGVPIGIMLAFFGCHFAMRKMAPNSDPAILPITYALSGIGIAFVTRLAPDVATRQLMWLIVGIGVFLLALACIRNLDKLKDYKYSFIFLGIILLLSPMLPIIGNEVNGSRLWLSLGPFSFQPGEIAKICIVIFLAGYLAQNREMLSIFTWKIGPVRLPSLATLLPLVFMWALAFLVVVLEKDLGSALVLFFVFIVMLYVATGQRFYIIVGILASAVAAFILYGMFSHVQTRVAIWLDPFADAQASGYQIVQSLYSLADGDIFGTGIGRGMCTNIPYVESDFIFSAIAEETGLLGGCGLLLLYLCFAIRGVSIAARAKSDISSFIAVGATSIIVLQAFIIVGGVTRLIPMTGITLPFISQGGSSLVCGFLVLALLVRAGDEGTGLDTEMHTTVISKIDVNAGVLGRFALGKRLTTIIIIFSFLFAALVANITYIMVIDAENIQNMPSNNHTMAKEAKTERGTISTHDGVVLARSEKQEDGTYERVYPSGSLASHVVGYYSARYGSAGIEASWNDTLKGKKNLATVQDVIDQMTGNQKSGNDVKLTLNSAVQEAAESAISGYSGACVVIDPKTGAVSALASSPTYEPSNIDEVMQQANSNSGDKTSALLNRATGSVRGPGSTFKTVTLSAALESGIATEDSTYNAPGSMTIGNATVTNFGNHSYGVVTLKRALALSLNTVFGQVGTQLGSKRLVDTAEKFGFNSEIDFDLPVAKSLMPDANEMTEWETAWAAAGEPVGEHKSPAGPQTNVMQMALVASAYANDGKIMKPYLVESSNNANGELSYSATSSLYKTPLSKDIANRVLECMNGVVTEGSASTLKRSGMATAAKTGTAENGGDSPDSWIICIGDAENSKSVVIALMLENAGEGTATAKVGAVLDAALKAQGVTN